MSKKAKRRLLTFIQIVLIIFILYNGYKIGSYYYDRYKAQQNFNETSAIFNEIIVDEGPDEVEVVREGLDIPKDEKAKRLIERLKGINPDIVAYIKIEGTRIDYPVVYKDNDYYLRRDIHGEYSVPGSIFIEETNNPDFSDRNTVLYGHNMSNGAANMAPMFMDTEKYVDQEFVNSGQGRIIEIYTEEGYKEYQVISAYYVNAFDNYRSTQMGDEEWVEYATGLLNKSQLDFGFDGEIGPEDKLITLSTCDNVDYDGRFTVHAIQIED